MVNRIPPPYQLERFIKPLARGEVLASVAGGKHLTTMDVSTFKRVDGGYHLDHVRKSYVTSAGHATHYLMCCRLEGRPTEGPPDFLFVERDHIAWQVVGDWNGLGLRSNSSSPMLFNGLVPEEHRLGIGHDDEPIMAKYLMPLLILTCGAAYLGIASGAYDLACQEGDKRFPSGVRRLDSPINQRRIADMSAQIEASQALLHTAAAIADASRAASLLPFIQAKVVCAEAAVCVTQDLSGEQS